MKIRIRLSHQSILNAIHKLNTANQNLRWSVADIAETLAEDGARIAQEAYGDMANVVAYMEDENVAKIATTGETNIIAEFGAGDATIPGYGFENVPDTPTYAGAYSESDEGAGMYAKYGWWKFGGKVYTEVEPRMGLVKAKTYIIETAEETAKEVIKL